MKINTEATRILTVEEKRARWRARNKARYAANPEKFKALTARTRTPEKSRRQQLKLKYGLTIEQFDALLIAQGYRCAICKKAIDAPRTPKEKRWNYRAVDHDHQSNKVRGLLCRLCNLMLGHSDDSVLILEAAINYLRQHEAVA